MAWGQSQKRQGQRVQSRGSGPPRGEETWERCVYCGKTTLHKLGVCTNCLPNGPGRY